MVKFAKSIIFGALISISGLSQAAYQSNIKFFSSNNTSAIDSQEACRRINSEAQLELENTVIDVLQKNHIEQGRLENILGVYRNTSDNSIIFYSSPKQYFSNKKVFLLASELANRLKQESTAVFIPLKGAPVANIIVTFTTKPSIKEILRLINQQLPRDYSTAFSLHLKKQGCEINQTRIISVEWLGSKISVKKLRKIFPHEKISYRPGKAYLIFKNGAIKSL